MSDRGLVALRSEQQPPAPGGEGEDQRIESESAGQEQRVPGAHTPDEGGEVRGREQVGEQGQAHPDLDEHEGAAPHGFVMLRISMASMSAPSVIVPPARQG